MKAPIRRKEPVSQPQKPPSIITWGDAGQKDRRQQFLEHFRNWPVPDSEFFLNLGMFLVPQTLGRILFMDHMYRQILPVQGIVAEFGCRWGQNLSLLTSLRGIHEPFNRLRKIVGFDTFQGFPSVSGQDGDLNQGMYSTAPDYAEYLAKVLQFQEGENPMSHIKKHEIVQGDASVTVPEYLKRNPHTIISMAYFDMDIYQPTRDVLLAIRDHLTQGSVIGFDELNDEACPGETAAVKEVLGLNRVAIRRFGPSSRTSYMVVDGPLS
ncbi:MAG TPA: crotonobetainyl-CoA--carnitine CoA-transferase [Verrucomicrobiae bacterium]|jgi:hypothetical protein|nr:crotonobetainyl-CoA--carnitine CoA-transferase [Verrucomicrobiae bacterium]